METKDIYINCILQVYSAGNPQITLEDLLDQSFSFNDVAQKYLNEYWRRIDSYMSKLEDEDDEFDQDAYDQWVIPFEQVLLRQLLEELDLEELEEFITIMEEEQLLSMNQIYQCIHYL